MTTELPEQLRLVMRQWTTGVAVVTSRFGSRVHGLTANSFNSVSLYPPLVTVTLEDRTRTRDLVERSGVFAVTILSAGQKQIADLFAGKLGREADRFAGVEVFSLESGAPLIAGGLAFLDCRVVASHPLGSPTLYLGEVRLAQLGEPGEPLVYHNRHFTRLQEP